VPRLYVVPTPIGNLEDVTLRALRILADVSLILAEDTRHTSKLTRHYGIKTPMMSYHQHNKRTRLDEALRALETGDVALVSNAGMPAVSDPGFELIQCAVESGVAVDVLPGPNAAVTAVVAACLPAPGFLVLGFLSRRSGERRRQLIALASLPYTLVLYEAPHRLHVLLREVLAVLGDRRMIAARELTKVHQEIVRGTVTEVMQRFETSEVRGELTLVLAGATEERRANDDDVRDALRKFAASGADARLAVSEVAARFALSRNATYSLWLEVRGQADDTW
jgi:16S rRNA (cytidine1402-2'-O)-methyltransferase